MNLGLKDEVALILASSKGLGLACAKTFYNEGVNDIFLGEGATGGDIIIVENRKKNIFLLYLL